MKHRRTKRIIFHRETLDLFFSNLNEISLCSCWWCRTRITNQGFWSSELLKKENFVYLQLSISLFFAAFCDIPIIYTQTIHHLSHTSLRDKHTIGQRDFLIQKRGQETNQNHKRTWIFDHSLFITQKKVGFNDLLGIFLNRTDSLNRFMTQNSIQHILLVFSKWKIIIKKALKCIHS